MFLRTYIALTGILLLPAMGLSKENELNNKKLPETWPNGWKKAYTRFQSFVNIRSKTWPKSTLGIDANGILSFKPLPVIQQGRHAGILTYHSGYTQPVSFSGKPLSLTRRYSQNGIISACVRGFTDVGYQHFGPLIRVSMKKNAQGIPVFSLIKEEKHDTYWPNWRGLLFIDFQTLGKQHPTLIYEKNTRVSPAISLKVDHQGNLRRKALPNASAEQALSWRIYHKGKLKEKGTASNQVKKNCGSQAGHYIAWLAIEGPDGMMPVSNIVTFYIYPEKYRTDNSLIEARDSDNDGKPDILEVVHGTNPNNPNDAPIKNHSSHLPRRRYFQSEMSWEFIPGYFDKRPWIYEKPENRE